MIPGLGDAIKGLSSGLFSGVADIIGKLKADPTKVIEAESALQTLKVNAELEAEKINVQMEQEFTKRIESENKGVSDRWAADMASDSWLSKNTRPLVMLSLLGFLFLMITLDSLKIEFEVKPDYINLMSTLLVTTVVAYFGSRGAEKIQSMRKAKA